MDEMTYRVAITYLISLGIDPATLLIDGEVYVSAHVASAAPVHWTVACHSRENCSRAPHSVRCGHCVSALQVLDAHQARDPTNLLFPVDLPVASLADIGTKTLLISVVSDDAMYLLVRPDFTYTILEYANNWVVVTEESDSVEYNLFLTKKMSGKPAEPEERKHQGTGQHHPATMFPILICHFATWCLYAGCVLWSSTDNPEDDNMSWNKLESLPTAEQLMAQLDHLRTL